MRRTLYVGRVLLALIPLLTSSAAHALANRVFVSQRSGNDANSCDNILTPCRTFAGAVAQLNPGGEAIVLDSGGYGPVTITQSLTIEAPPGVLAFIHPPTPVDAITVNAPGATVVLRGLTINGAGQTTGNGIRVLAAAALHVENLVITGFAGSFPADGIGIYSTASGQLFVKDTISRANGFAGILVKPSLGTTKTSLDRCRLEQNGWGLVIFDLAQATIKDSVLSGNFRGSQAAGGDLNMEGCLIANNSMWGVASSGGTTRVSNCTITDNNVGVLVLSGSMLSRSNNTVQGNTTTDPFTGTYTAD